MDWELARGVAYVGFTILFTIFLYSYIVSLYVRDKKGITDYEKYAQLVLRDNLDDAIIEPRNAQNSAKTIKD